MRQIEPLWETGLLEPFERGWASQLGDQGPLWVLQLLGSFLEKESWLRQGGSLWLMGLFWRSESPL